MSDTEKRKKKKKRKKRLPKRLIPVANPDKKFHEKWTKGRDELDIPHPSRILAVGPPGCGKSWVLGQILVRSNPPYEELFVVHPDPEYTKEWNNLGAKMLGEIPSPEDWEGEVKTLVVIDDLEIKQLSKDQSRALDRLFGYVSTHKNITVYLTTQNFANIPAAVRRMSNFWIIWKINDTDAMRICSKKAGLKKNDLEDIFEEHCPEFHDSIWIDRTKKTPFPLRKNGYEIIEKN